MLLKNQRNVSSQISLPVDTSPYSFYVNEQSGETINFYYFDTQTETFTAGEITNPSATTIQFTPTGGHAYTKNQKIIITAANYAAMLGEWTISAVSTTVSFDIDMASIFQSVLPISSATATCRASFPIRTADSNSAAGTIVTGKLLKRGILDQARTNIATYRDTSFAWITGADGQVFVNNLQQPFSYSVYENMQEASAYDKAVAITEGFSNGSWTIDYRTGTFWGKKATIANGDTCNYACYLPTFSDDQANSWTRVLPTPTNKAINALSNAVSSALESSRVVKNSLGRLYKLFVYNNGIASTWVQVFNATSLPANGTVPLITFAVGAGAVQQLSFDVFGVYCSSGIVVANSSTPDTLTVGAANLWIMAQYV